MVFSAFPIKTEVKWVLGVFLGYCLNSGGAPGDPAAVEHARQLAHQAEEWPVD